MPSALRTSVVVWVLSIAQPATKREKASRTTQQYSLPSRVGCSVMSVIQSWSGPPRRNSRRTRSSEVTIASLAPVGSRLVGRPLMPGWRMISETELWPTATPRPCLSSAVTRSAP